MLAFSAAFKSVIFFTEASMAASWPTKDRAVVNALISAEIESDKVEIAALRSSMADIISSWFWRMCLRLRN